MDGAVLLFPPRTSCHKIWQHYIHLRIATSVILLCGSKHFISVYACAVHNTHATQVILYRHSTDNFCTTSISTLNQFL